MWKGRRRLILSLMSGWLVRPLIISDVNLKRVLIGGTLCPFDRDMKKLSKTV